MKLFKKLAAAMLVAALALTMVGCGGSSSLLDQVKNVITDVYAMKDKELTNKKSWMSWRQSWWQKQTRLLQRLEIRTKRFWGCSPM